MYFFFMKMRSTRKVQRIFLQFSFKFRLRGQLLAFVFSSFLFQPKRLAFLFNVFPLANDFCRRSLMAIFVCLIPPRENMVKREAACFAFNHSELLLGKK